MYFGTSRRLHHGGRQLNADQKHQGQLDGKELLFSGNKISETSRNKLPASWATAVQCERLDVAYPAAARPPFRLQKLRSDTDEPPLLIRLEPAQRHGWELGRADLKKWNARGRARWLLLLPYAKRCCFKPHLAKEVAAFQSEAARLSIIDRELDFLRGIEQPPPYLTCCSCFKSVRRDPLFAVAERPGEVPCAPRFVTAQQCGLSHKLIASAFFTNVIVEEQCPPDRKRSTANERTDNCPHSGTGPWLRREETQRGETIFLRAMLPASAPTRKETNKYRPLTDARTDHPISIVASDISPVYGSVFGKKRSDYGSAQDAQTLPAAGQTYQDKCWW